jgi:hypothetical protein
MISSNFVGRSIGSVEGALRFRIDHLGSPGSVSAYEQSCGRKPGSRQSICFNKFLQKFVSPFVNMSHLLKSSGLPAMATQ